MKKNVLIFGSCVSRDVFGIDYNKNEVLFRVVDYYARSSFASAFHPIIIRDKYSLKLKSKFQQRIVKSDLIKQFALIIRSIEFDLLLVDFIDERFNLFQFNNQALCTLSNEMIATGFYEKKPRGRLIESGSDEFYNLWETGWSVFIAQLKELGALNRLRVNKALWAVKTVDGGNFLPSYSSEGIEKANAFLKRLYDRVSLDISDEQFLEFSEGLLQGATNHRWGLSPFHYVEDYYKNVCWQLTRPSTLDSDRVISPISLEKTGVQASPAINGLINHHPEIELPRDLIDRDLIDWKKFPITNQCDQITKSNMIRGNGTVNVYGSHIEMVFNGGFGVYQLWYILPSPLLVNGISIRYRLRNWDSIKYFAIGYTFDGQFRHVKLFHSVRDQWVDFSIGHQDIAFSLQNQGSNPEPAVIKDIRIYLRGTPQDAGSWLDIEHFFCWNENKNGIPLLTSLFRPNVPENTHQETLAEWLSYLIDDRLIDVIYAHVKRSFPCAQEQAHSFLNKGTCPLFGNIDIPWPSQQAFPIGFFESSEQRLSWSAFHPVMIWLIYARERGISATFFAARDFITTWFDKGYCFTNDDIKYTWNGYSTADRLLTFLLFWPIAMEYQFDYRFKESLFHAIFRHAQLLESDSFYAAHQLVPDHLSAWLQDLVLMAVSQAFPDLACASRWFEVAKQRVTGRIEHCLEQSDERSSGVKNFMADHYSVERLQQFTTELAILGVRAESAATHSLADNQQPSI